MTAVRNASSRGGHEAIKETRGRRLEMRQGMAENDLFERLAADSRLGLSRDQIEALVADPVEFTGAARDQVASVVRRVEAALGTDPEAAAYVPGAIL